MGEWTPERVEQVRNELFEFEQRWKETRPEPYLRTKWQQYLLDALDEIERLQHEIEELEFELKEAYSDF